MFNKFILLTDDQIKDMFDHFRNLGICGAIFAASSWELSRIQSLASAMGLFDAFVFFILVVMGAWLFFIAQSQAFRKLKKYGVVGMKLVFFGHLYNLVAVTLIISIFLPALSVHPN